MQLSVIVTSIQFAAGKKRFVVSVVSVCEIPLRYKLKVRPYVEENGQEKLRWCIIWQGGKSIFCGIYMFLCFLFASASPLLKTSLGSTDSDNKDINKTDFKSCNSGFGLPPRFKPFWRGVHVRERRYKKTNDKVSLTLRDCLGLSIQGRNSINFNFQSIFNSINFKDLTAQYLDQATIRE